MARGGFTTSIHYVRQIAEQVRRQGTPVAAWLAQSGLTEADLRAGREDVDFETFAGLVRTSLSMTNEPALGLLVGESLLATTHGMLGYAALHSGTVRQALEVLERYTRVRTSILSIAVEAKGAGVVHARIGEACPLGDVRVPILEAVVLTLKNVLGTISTGACRIKAVVFPFPAPAHAALAREIIGCDVQYGRSFTGLVLASADLDVPLKMGDPEAFREAALVCQRALDALTADESVSARVRRVLLEKASGFPSLPVAARLFHMTPRTLHRRLTEEGTSYRQILEDVRHALAVEHLRSGRLRMEEIAYALGYSDLANFRRAFKRWEGVAPSDYARRDAPRRTRKRGAVP